MAAPPSSSSLPSEMSAKLHPYQELDGPKGAFEARKVKGGLYIRVDMPGVPNDGVKVVKYDDTRTVTFSGKAPSVWAGFDSSDRVYAGYVVLDRDPSDVQIKYGVVDGCFRMFFPNFDGSLHSLAKDNNTPLPEKESNSEEEEQIIPADPNLAFILHSPPNGIGLSGGSREHINPYLLSGTKGIYEHKVVHKKEGKPLVYVRVDVPGSCSVASNIIENQDRAIGYTAGKPVKDSPYDDGPRFYFGTLAPACGCCRYKVVKHYTTNGVLRFLAEKSDNFDSTPVCHCTLPGSHGGPPQPFTVPLIGDMPPSFDQFHI